VGEARERIDVEVLADLYARFSIRRHDIIHVTCSEEHGPGAEVLAPEEPGSP
jgi:hypothetical protein